MTPKWPLNCAQMLSNWCPNRSKMYPVVNPLTRPSKGDVHWRMCNCIDGQTRNYRCPSSTAQKKYCLIFRNLQASAINSVVSCWTLQQRSFLHITMRQQCQPCYRQHRCTLKHPSFCSLYSYTTTIGTLKHRSKGILSYHLQFTGTTTIPLVVLSHPCRREAISASI